MALLYGESMLRGVRMVKRDLAIGGVELTEGELSLRGGTGVAGRNWARGAAGLGFAGSARWFKSSARFGIGRKWVSPAL